MVSYTPSAAADELLSSKTNSILSRTFLGIGGVPYDSITRGMHPSARHAGNEADPYDLSNVHNLPSSEEEIRSAAAVIDAQPATFAVGDKATKANFERENVSQYGTIHFAVHARADVTNPDLSYLLLDPAPPNQDGFLQPRDIMQRDLPGSLVVLSACDTAVGHLQGEEGVANISRSFFIAGASSVVSTLWKIDDTYSLFLTKTFYEHLNSGESAGDSLRAAKMAVLEKFGQNTPVKYWGGFVLTGNGQVRMSTRPVGVQTAQIWEGIDAGDHH